MSILIKRREFLRLSGFTTASLMAPRFLNAFGQQGLPPKGKVVVVLQLDGGNDGLNTVIPISNDLYHRARPKIALTAKDALGLTDDVALHPSLVGLRELYQQGQLAILNQVGYPEPNRSHFRSMDIWQTASQSDEVLHTGWIGRVLDIKQSPSWALEMDEVLSLALKGKETKGLSAGNPSRLHRDSNGPLFKQLAASHAAQHTHGMASYLYKTLAETVSHADRIFKESKSHATKAPYPNTLLGNDFKTVASLILSDMDTQVYYLSLGSFDTHVNQNQRQSNLFTQLDDAVMAFVKDMKANNRFEDILLFTFSEFGRRVAQNASGGTDHGTANNLFFISGSLKQQGLLNPLPDLGNLQDGDLTHEIDFKRVYATILENWLDNDSKAILGSSYSKLGFI
ncbi:DUF1501 domain-containing protein [Parapedobacter tibetensis]|uniref:DUF1501 domain-containing protein n=1 Tax=Parapedobacter tibetensis TaxID=2972951 RepID=UPI00214D2497|nr:DUF1501 domain-containing protein [Parapedobacter tibetensis]